MISIASSNNIVTIIDIHGIVVAIVNSTYMPHASSSLNRRTELGGSCGYPFDGMVQGMRVGLLGLIHVFREWMKFLQGLDKAVQGRLSKPLSWPTHFRNTHGS